MKAVAAFIAAACVGVFAPALLAQPKVYRIVMLERDSAEANAVNVNALRRGFRELGYVEGKNLAIEYRSADGRDDRYPALCAEAVGLKADLIVVRGTPPGLACKRATGTIPIVFAGAGDPVGDGLVASFARPGGNITGFTSVSNELAAKRLEVLREVFPKAAHIGALMNLGNPNVVSHRKQLEAAAQVLGIRISVFDVRTSADLQTALEQAAKQRVDAVYVPIDSLTDFNRKLIADLALKHRLPTINAESTYVDAGGLISYGSNTPARYHRLATVADKIFKGAKAGDIPVEQPGLFLMAINLKTAKALRVTIPKEVLFRADRVIQ
jgi:putative ABC transport system substrate-binding protein